MGPLVGLLKAFDGTVHGTLVGLRWDDSWDSYGLTMGRLEGLLKVFDGTLEPLDWEGWGCSWIGRDKVGSSTT